MNERVTNILNQNITKTAKIQQLLLLGLTRRQVADLVTNGNYGFVQNVYKKMLETGRFGQQPAIAAYPELDYTFNRRFGIEIEAYNCEKGVLARELREAGIAVAVEGYNHNTRDHWKLVTDSSLRGERYFRAGKPDTGRGSRTAGTSESMLGARLLQCEGERQLRPSYTHGRCRLYH